MNRTINTIGRFKNFGEELQAVYNAAKPGGIADFRLENLVSGMGEGATSDGGFLVQEDYVTELTDVLYNDNCILSKVRRFPVSGNSNTLKINGVNENSRADGSRWGGVQVFWEKEADEIAGSKPSFEQITMTLKKLTGLCYATDELLEDAPALDVVIKQAFSDEFGFNLTEKILYGSGAGEPLGIFNSNALVTIEKEANQTEMLTVENLLKMLAVCYDKRGRAEWYLNRELIPHLCTLKIGDTPIYLPEKSIANAPYGTLLGKPVNFIEQAAAPGSKGDILLADMSQYAIAEKYSGIRAAESIHVRFIYDETVFRFVYRVDGCPLVNNVIAPYKGSIPTSPFVTLGNRNAQEVEG